MLKRKNTDYGEDSITIVDVALRNCYPAMKHVAVFCAIANLSTFSTTVFFMLSLNTVLSTASIMTLASYFALFVMFNALTSFMQYLSTTILKELSAQFSTDILSSTYKIGMDISKIGQNQFGVNLMSDIEVVRDFYVGPNVVSLFQIPWAIIYIMFCFWVQFWIGVCSILTLGVVLALNLLGRNNFENQESGYDIQAEQSKYASALKEKVIDTSIPLDRNEILLDWNNFATRYMYADTKSLKLAKFKKNFLKFWRYFSSFGSGGLVAILAIYGMASGNDLLAVSLAIQALVGIGQVVNAQIPYYEKARVAYKRSNNILLAFRADKIRYLSLPSPKGNVQAVDLGIVAPNTNRFILSQVSFTVSAGSTMAVIGPSGAGKSTLVRALVGIWPPTHGSVRLDGSELHHWDADQLGLHLGYLPQNVELLSGTIAENIARFGAIDDEAVLDAARLAGVHDVIQGLPQGYNTQVGEGGSALSGGQRQGVGLARALYGGPALVVLDEPNSNLDALGESALADALRAMKERGTTCILVTDQASMLKMVDLVLSLKDGTMTSFGSREKFENSFISSRANIHWLPTIIEG